MTTRVLVLEDDAELRACLAETLEDEGYAVWAAGDAQSAIELARREGHHLVVTDIRMAGMDGLDALAEISKRLPLVKSIVITGYADESAPARAIRARADDYLQKPFTMAEFLQVVSRVLHQDQERESYLEVVRRSLSGLWGRVEKGLAHAQLVSLEGKRTQAFQAFFVAVRAERLSPLEARHFWDRLTELETRRRELLETLNLKLRSELAHDYADLAEVLGSPGSALNLPRAVATSVEERRRFNTLYRRIRSGEVSPERLKMAVFLLDLDTTVLRDSPELRLLFVQLWGPPEG